MQKILPSTKNVIVYMLFQMTAAYGILYLRRWRAHTQVSGGGIIGYTAWFSKHDTRRPAGKNEVNFFKPTYFLMVMDIKQVNSNHGKNIIP